MAPPASLDQQRKAALRAVLAWARRGMRARRPNTYRLKQFAADLSERAIALEFLDGRSTDRLVSQDYPTATQERVEAAIRNKTSPRRVR